MAASLLHTKIIESLATLTKEHEQTSEAIIALVKSNQFGSDEAPSFIAALPLQEALLRDFPFTEGYLLNDKFSQQSTLDIYEFLTKHLAKLDKTMTINMAGARTAQKILDARSAATTAIELKRLINIGKRTLNIPSTD